MTHTRDEIDLLIDDAGAQGLSAPLQRAQHRLRGARRRAAPDAAFAARLRARLLPEQGAGLRRQEPPRRAPRGDVRRPRWAWRAPTRTTPTEYGYARTANRSWLVAALVVLCIGAASAMLARTLTVTLRGNVPHQSVFGHVAASTGGNPGRPADIARRLPPIGPRAHTTTPADDQQSKRRSCMLAQGVYRALSRNSVQLAIGVCAFGAATAVTLHHQDGPRSIATHPATAAPRSTPTPRAMPGNLIVASTSSSLTDATATFSAGTPRYWCVARLPGVPINVGIDWRWQHLRGNIAEDIWTSPPYTYSSAVRYGYIEGPFAPGRYRCQVRANGRLLGSATFVVQPASTTPAPIPTPQPIGATLPPTLKHAKVVVATSPSVSAARAVFPADTARFWCLPTRRAQGALIFTWRQGTALFWESPAFTYAPDQQEAGYMDGPFAPGRYSCSIRANGRLVGTAPFVVR